jgi:hypothetical protein
MKEAAPLEEYKSPVKNTAVYSSQNPHEYWIFHEEYILFHGQ